MTTNIPRLSKEEEAERREAAASLWLSSFDDDESFVRFYFDRIVLPEELFLYRIGERAVAHIHAPTYPLATGGEAYYISGACTLEEYRGQGLMKKLMSALLRREYTAGRLVALLIPANENLRCYYRKHFGFVTNNYRYTSTNLEDALSYQQTLRRSYVAGQRKEQCAFIHDCLLQLPLGGVRHSLRQLDNVLEEYSRWAHVATFADHHGSLEEIALYRIDSNGRGCIDAFFGNKPDRLAELQTSGNDLLITLPAGIDTPSVSSTARGMARPINLLTLAQKLAARQPELSYTFSYLDELLPKNTGTYTLLKGQVTYTPELLDQPLSEEAAVQLLLGEYWLAMMHD